MLRVVGYTRVSTEEQAKSGLGMEAQEKKIRAYAELFDLDLVAIIADEGISGKTMNRPGLHEVCDLLERKDVQGVIVAKLDRLTRSVSDLGIMVKTLFEKAELFSVSEQVDTRSAAGRLVLNVLVSVAQWERETICERTKDALESKKARNEKTGGYTPFGKSEVEGKLENNAAEQEIIAIINEKRASGYTLKAIAEFLNAEGIPTKNGKEWGITQVARVLKAA